MMVRVGICSLLAGFFIGVFSGVSSFMEEKNLWSDLTISKIIGEDTSESIIGFIDVMAIQDGLDVLIYEIPFSIVVFGFGVIVLLLSLFMKNH